MMRRWDKPPCPRDQMVLCGPSLDQRLPDDHPVRVFDGVLARHDWSAWEARYSAGPGRPPIPPRVMASIVLWGLSDGMRSSRKLENACGVRLDFQWLAEGRVPDHSTLCAFRNAFGEELAELMVTTCRVAMELGLAALNEIALDGTRVRANSSRHGTLTAESIEKELAELREAIDEMLAEAKAADEAETDLFGERVTPHRLPSKLARMEDRQKRLEKALAAAKAKEAKPKAARDQDGADDGEEPDDDSSEDNDEKESEKRKAPRVPVADPDSTVQPNKDGGYAPNYTPMVATESQGGFIVDADVLPDGDEPATTVATAERIAATYEVGIERLLADAAHGSGENLAALAAQGISPYIPPLRRYDEPDNPARRDDPAEPVPEEAWDKLPRNPQTGHLDRSAFLYDPEADCYWCPAGRRLTFAGEQDKHGRPYRRYRAEASCRDCPRMGSCTTSRDGRRTVCRDAHETAREAADARLATEEGRAIYRRRAPAAETPFGYIKTQMHLRQFLHRGLERVKTEWLWACVAYNLGKLVRALAQRPGGGVEALARSAALKDSCVDCSSSSSYAHTGSLGGLSALQAFLDPFARHHRRHALAA